MWTKEDIEGKVKDNKIIIFAKGTKDAPRCGFSMRAIDVMRRFDKPFEVIDVLSEASIRPALVAFSQWPTTPQVFLDGELLGGSDIIQEMFDSGDLRKKIADSFGEDFKAEEQDQRVTVTPEALAKVRDFMESSDEFLRLDVKLKDGSRVFELSIDTQSRDHEDATWNIDGVRVVTNKNMATEFDKLKVDWVVKNGQQGFSVLETGEAPPLPVPLSITKSGVAELLAKDDVKVVVVDVREADEWAAGHVDGAVHVPLSNLQKEWQAKGFDKNDTFVLYCAKGARSMNAANFVRKEFGFANVRSLDGGISQFPKT